MNKIADKTKSINDNKSLATAVVVVGYDGLQVHYLDKSEKIFRVDGDALSAAREFRCAVIPF